MGNESFDKTALRITPSPPPSQGSASPAVESKFLVRVRNLHYARLGLSILFVALGTAVMGCEGHALYTYNSTHLKSEWWLPLWPQYFDLGPTVTILSGGAIVTLTSLVYTVIALLPSPHSRTTLLNTLFTALVCINTLALLIVLGYTIHLNHNDSLYGQTNLSSWTCRWASGVSGSDVATSNGASSSSSSIFGDNGGIVAPSGFGRICKETKAAWGITIAMVVLMGVGGAMLMVWGWWVGFRVWRARRKEEKKWEQGEQQEGWAMQNGGADGHGDAAVVA